MDLSAVLRIMENKTKTNEDEGDDDDSDEERDRKADEGSEAFNPLKVVRVHLCNDSKISGLLRLNFIIYLNDK